MRIGDIPVRRHPATLLPSALDGLGRLAVNFYWAWHREAHALFARLDSWRGDSTASPIALLRGARNLECLAKDAVFLGELNRAVAVFDAYMADGPTGAHGIPAGRPVAYFCAEYGLHECFAQYCGGLGILAGDHCREASDMRMPFVAIGCFYHLGFFRQSLERFGRQSHVSDYFDPEWHPVERVLDPRTNQPLTIPFEFPGRAVHVAVWRAAVGRTPLLLLDTNVPQNEPADRAITAQLYMVGREMRFHQEMVLGMAGVRALRALGIEPSCYHMNEGHSALMLVERLMEQTRTGKSWAEAQEAVRAQSVLTIHTPVPAGNERFDARLVGRLLSPSLHGSCIAVGQLQKLARDSENDPKVFDMTAFALRLSRAANGVSALHGRTADGTWRPVTGVRVGAVTNGVHLPTWLGAPMRRVYEAYGARLHPATAMPLTPRAGGRPAWEGIEEVPDAELWDAHLEQKRALVAFASDRLHRQHVRYGESPEELRALAAALDPEAFLIGFARRMTGYKRPWLILSDLKRLLSLLDSPGRPVQILFSGKAHPLDEEGQAVLADIYRRTQAPRLKGRVFLLEDYDMAVGRALVQGVDLWVNNPLRPLEASGTSGMKAAVNGVPNCSVLDGWWDEAIEEEPRNGWAAGAREPRKTRRQQDKFDAESLYATLEGQVLPLFWERGPDGVPHRWVAIMKRTIATSAYAFSTRRMLEDYAELVADEAARLEASR
jgi:starch phosphorylase